jgi:chemotaxis protein MotB
LVEHNGLNPVRVSAAGYGEFKPHLDNRTEEDRQQNRRVDIVLLNSTISNAEKGQ